MRIGVDVTPLRPPFTGVSNYSLYLLDALTLRANDLHFAGFGLSSWATVDRSFLIDVASRSQKTLANMERPRAAPHNGIGSKFAQLLRPLLWRSSFAHRVAHRLHRMRRQARFENSAPKQRLDVFHALNFCLPGSCAIPVIPTVYDLSHVRFPQAHRTSHLQFLERLARDIERAAAVHTISEFSAREIADVYGVPRQKIAVVYPGVSPVYHEKPAVIDATLSKYDLRPHAYTLTVSTLEPRKNLSTLLDAFARLRPAERQRIPLCVVGHAGWGDIGLSKSVAALEHEGSIRFLGYVPEPDLRDLYLGTRLLLYPSLYEGFGLPAAEALACGAPVAVSNAASLPEVVGDAGSLIAPHDEEAWTACLRGALEDEGALAENRRAARVRQARRFSWHAAAEATEQIYRAAKGTEDNI